MVQPQVEMPCHWLSTRWRQRLLTQTKPWLMFRFSTRCDWRFKDSGRSQPKWRWRRWKHLTKQPQWRAVDGEGGGRWRETGSDSCPASETSQHLYSTQPARQAAHQTGQPRWWVNQESPDVKPHHLAAVSHFWWFSSPAAPPVPVKKSPATLPRNFTLPKDPHGSLLRGRISTPTGSPHLGALHPQLPPSCIIEELHRALATKHRQDRSDARWAAFLIHVHEILSCLFCIVSVL